MIEVRPLVKRRLGHRGECRAQAIGVGKLHAGKLRTGFGGHQVPVAGQHVAAQGATEERTTSGGDHHRRRFHPPCLMFLPRDTRGTADASVRVGQQLQGRTVVKNTHARLLHPLAHQAHVFGALQGHAALFAGTVQREGIPPVGEGLHIAVGLREHAVHPGGLGQIATPGITAGLGRFALARIGLDVPDGGARRRGGPGCAAVALVGQYHTGTTGGGADGCPGTRRPPADDQHIGTPLPAAHALLQT